MQRGLKKSSSGTPRALGGIIHLRAPRRGAGRIPSLARVIAPRGGRFGRAGAALLGLLVLAGLPAYAGGPVNGCTEQAFTNALAGGGLVTFSNDCSLTLTQPASITAESTTIDAGGHSVTISGGNAVRLFNVSGGLKLVGLTLVNGQSPAGAALFIGAGATVTLTNCTLAGNSASGAAGSNGNNGTSKPDWNGTDGTDATSGSPGNGGAIYNLGAVAVINCNFTTNSALGGNGGSGGNGGNGLYNGGNGGDGGSGATGSGGAIFNLGDLTLINCSLTNNSATGGKGGWGGTSGTGIFPGRAGIGAPAGASSGGALYNGRNLTVRNCTFANNSCQGGDGGIGGTLENGNGTDGNAGANGYGGGLCSTLWAVVTNSTFWSNSVAGGDGGDGGSGLNNAGNGGNGGDASGGCLYNSGTMTIVNCTLASGGATAGTNGVAGLGTFFGSDGHSGQSRGGDAATTAGAFGVMNSIFSTNLSGGNVYGAVTDLGHNLCSDSSFPAGSTSRNNTDPKLGPLAANGGPTLTMALLSGSPAIDAIGSNSGSFPRTDQRGIQRPIGAGADIGAYEAPVAASFSIQQPTLVSNRLNIVFPSQASLSYVLQYKSQLTNSSWISLNTNTGTGGLLTNQDFTTNQPARFYRVQVQ